MNRNLTVSVVAILVVAVTAVTIQRLIVLDDYLPSEKPELDLSEVPKLVMAFYHPWYGNITGPTGEWKNWNLNNHNPDVFISPERRDTATADYPIVGPYDNMDPWLIRWHLGLALEAGIDVFIMCQISHHEANFKAIMDLAENEGLKIKFCFLIGLKYYNSAQEVKNWLSYSIQQYGNRSSYLKVQNLPVFFSYGSLKYSADVWKGILDDLRRGGQNLLLFGDTTKEDYAEVFDGLQHYSSAGWIYNNYSIPHRYEFIAERAMNHSLPFGLPVVPGFNNSGVDGWGSTVFVVPRENGAIYNYTWEAILGADPHWALICSWNEWFEGSEIEPSLEYGYRYLKITKYFSEIFKGQS